MDEQKLSLVWLIFFLLAKVKIPACYRHAIPNTAKKPAVVKIYRHAGSAVVKFSISTANVCGNYNKLVNACMA